MQAGINTCRNGKCGFLEDGLQEPFFSKTLKMIFPRINRNRKICENLYMFVKDLQNFVKKYSLRSKIHVGEMDVCRRILVLNTSIFLISMTSNSGRREYYDLQAVQKENKIPANNNNNKVGPFLCIERLVID